MNKKKVIGIIVATVAVLSVLATSCGAVGCGSGATVTTTATGDSGFNLPLMSQNIAELKTKYDALNSTVILLQSNVTNLETRLNTLQTTYEELNTDGLASQEDMDAVLASITETNTQIESLQEQITNLLASIAVMQQQIDTLNTQVAELQTPITTTTPTTTTTATPLTAAQAIEVSIAPLIGSSILDVNNEIDTDQAFFLTFKYKNTTNIAYNNVKFNLIFYSDLAVIDIVPVNGFKVNTVSSSTLFWAYAGYTSSGYIFMSAPGINIGANADGEYMLQVIIKLATPPITKDAYLYPSISVVS